jgi:hypothetical protein
LCKERDLCQWRGYGVQRFQQYLSYFVTSVFLTEKTVVSATCHWQALSHNAVLSTHRNEWDSNSQL